MERFVALGAGLVLILDGLYCAGGWCAVQIGAATAGIVLGCLFVLAALFGELK